MEFTRSQVEKSLRRYHDYSSDLLTADWDTFNDRAQRLIQFCKSDAVFSRLHSQLVSVQGANFKEWLAEKLAQSNGWVGGCPLEYPQDDDQRISIMYQLLVAFAEGEYDVRDFGINFLTVGGNFDAIVEGTSKAVLQPLLRELEYRIEDIEGRLPKGGSDSFGVSLLQIVHNSGSFVQQLAHGDGNTQSATVRSTNPAVNEMLEKLGNMANSPELSREDRQKSDEILSHVKSELAAQSPKRIVVEALLKALPFATAATTLIASIIKAIWP